MLALKNIDLQFSNHFIFRHASFTLFAGQKYGLVGRNGTGKSSLFALIRRALLPDGGDVVYSNQLILASIEQEIENLNQNAIEYVIQGHPIIGPLWMQMLNSEKRENYDVLAEVHQKLADLNAYAIEAEASSILHGLGFQPNDIRKPIKAFSGGWRMRLNLARCLLTPADILLLDEPTNHLDLDAIIWLENYLKHFQGSLILISHDRHFLDATTDHILAIENKQLHTYKGNYSQYEHEKNLKFALQQKQFEKQTKERDRVMQFVNRFRAKATKAKQVQSRIKMLEKLPDIAMAQADAEYHIDFFESPPLTNPVFSLDKVDFAYGDHTVFKNIHFALHQDARIGLLGLNGAGKSTLIKLIVGDLTPDKGVRKNSAKLNIGYFAQHQLEALNPDETALWHMKQLAPEKAVTDLRTYLGRFAFSGDKVKQAVGDFSGGEKSRLCLALIIWQRPNFLLLDEPTNHLDMEMREALILGLQQYDGVLVMVSHDRSLLEASVDELYLVDNHAVQPFDGTLDDYAKWSQDKRKQLLKIPAKNKASNNQKDIQSIEKTLEKLNNRLKKLDIALIEAQADLVKLQALSSEREAILKAIEDAEASWLDLHQ